MDFQGCGSGIRQNLENSEDGFPVGLPNSGEFGCEQDSDSGYEKI